jgi:hypothetical protein
MRFRRLIAAVAGAAALAASVVAVSAPAAQASVSCPAANDGFFINSVSGQVDHWYSKGGYFTAPYSGHQELCEVNPHPGYLQMVIVGGTASGQCVAYVKGGAGGVIEARPCVLGQANETWSDVYWPTGDLSWVNADTGGGGCLNVGTGSGDSWGIAACQDVPQQLPGWVFGG